MKKLIIFKFLALFMLALLASCSSDDEATTLNNGGDSTKKHGVVVNVKGFDTEILNLKSYHKESCYINYDVLVNIPERGFMAIKKDSFMVVDNNFDFSSLRFQEDLIAGDYVIGISVEKSDFDISDELYNKWLSTLPEGYDPTYTPYPIGYAEGHEYPYPAPDYPQEPSVTFPNNLTELFVGTVKFSVTDDSPANIETNLVLSRVVGKVEVVINDAKNMPASMTKLKARVDGFVPRLYFMSKGKSIYFKDNQPEFNEYGLPNLHRSTEEASRADITANDEYVFSFYMLANDSVFSYEASPDIKTDLHMVGDNGFDVKIKDGLKVYKNKITRLTGSLFGDTGHTEVGTEVGGGVSYETKWNSEVIKESF